jgi:hypothetical protein
MGDIKTLKGAVRIAGLTCERESLSLLDNAQAFRRGDLIVCATIDRGPVETTAASGSAAGRRKIWQLDRPFHCSILGTCLSLQELRILCRKLRITVQAPLSAYELHRSFVAVAAEPTAAARRLHKHLDRKYWATILRYTRAHSAPALEALWEAAVECGEWTGAYWALATHPEASAGLLERVYGEVHMLSHVAGAAVRRDSQELGRLKGMTATLRKQLIGVDAKGRARVAERDIQIKRLHERLAQAQMAARQLDQTRARLRAMEAEPLSLRLRKQVEDYAANLALERVRAERAEASAGEWKHLATRHGDRYQHLVGQLAELQAERKALEATLQRLLSADCATCTEQRDGCRAGINLCGRCILYVGGRTRQSVHFHALVERQNGRFMHHDGGLHGGRLRLGSLLPQADVVFCPLDCVSHDAANRVKQFCKRHEKRLVLLPSASLAAFTRGLNELAA